MPKKAFLPPLRRYRRGKRLATPSRSPPRIVPIEAIRMAALSLSFDAAEHSLSHGLELY